MKQIGLEFGRAILSLPKAVLSWYEARKEAQYEQRRQDEARAQETTERRKKWSEFATSHIAQRDANRATSKKIPSPPVRTPQETLAAVNTYWNDVQSGVATPTQALNLQLDLRVACARATTQQSIKQDLELIVANNSILQRAKKVEVAPVDVRRPVLTYIAKESPAVVAGLVTGTAGMIAYAGTVLSTYRQAVDTAFASYGLAHLKSVVQQSDFWARANPEVTHALITCGTTVLVTLPIAYALLSLTKWYRGERKVDAQTQGAIATVKAGTVAANEYQTTVNQPAGTSFAKINNLSDLISRGVNAARSLLPTAEMPVVSYHRTPARLNYLSKYFSKVSQTGRSLMYRAASVLMSL